VETRNPAQEQIVFGVEDIHTRVSAFRKVVPRSRLIHPADVKSERISRHEDRANKFDGFIQTVSGTRTRATNLRLVVHILTGECAHCQDQSRRQYQEKTADHVQFHFVTPTGWLVLCRVVEKFKKLSFRGTLRAEESLFS
jgi:uncharacterized cupin superfamily protein